MYLSIYLSINLSIYLSKYVYICKFKYKYFYIHLQCVYLCIQWLQISVVDLKARDLKKYTHIFQKGTTLANLQVIDIAHPHKQMPYKSPLIFHNGARHTTDPLGSCTGYSHQGVYILWDAKPLPVIRK